MDSYLESLVKKGEEVAVETAEATEDVIEEVAASESVVEATEGVEIAAEEVDTVVEETEEVEEASEVADDVAEEAPEVIEEVPEQEPQPELKKEIQSADEETLSVTNIKVYNVPDPAAVFKIFTGNVICKEMIGEMRMIEYVKPGFGLVKGFTPDLK